MEKLPMCRICLVQNVRMFIVVNRTLRELYEKLTDVPFLTEDNRPILACFFCCAKLKQCHRLQRKCLEAEELFAQMMNEDYEVNPLINQDHLEFCGGLIKCPIVHLSVVDECQTEIIAIQEDLPAVCEQLDDIIEPNLEHQSDEIEPQNLDNSCIDVADIVPHHSESDLENDVHLVEEEQGVSKIKRRVRETKRVTVAKKPKLDSRTTNPEDATTVEHTRKDESYSKFIRTIHKRTSKPGTYFKEPYKCDQSSFNRVKKIIQKTRTQISEISYKCDVCQLSFSQKGDLARHIRIHTVKKPYECDVCQRSFSQKVHLSRHVRKHIGEKCDLCQRSFSHKGDLKKHIRIHTGEKPYKCAVCQRNFSQKSNLSRHILIHTGEKLYSCDVCQRSFSQKSDIAKHFLIHTGEKPYKCDVCQRSFKVPSNLSRHIRIHTAEKPYKCDVCQRSFSLKHILTTHIRIHTSEKLFKCDVCQRSFSRKGGLTRHIRLHTGGKLYNCDVCQRSFNDKSNLSRHIRIHTGDKPK